MLRLRPKIESEDSKEWSCCYCFHVRTGTILLGVWHLLLHLLALGFLAAIVRDPRLLEELERETAASPYETRATPLASPGTRSRDLGTNMFYHDVDVGALVTVCTLTLTLMLIYGATRGKPSHLLPFFCMQIFDFAITVLTVMGYLCYLQSLHRLVEEAKRVPWREELLALPSSILAMIVLGVFLAAILIKGYFISVVWRCYKYMSLRAHGMRSLTPFVISSDGGMNSAVTSFTSVGATDYSSNLLPDYDEAVKQTPPPSYRAATLMTTDPANAADPKQDQDQNQAPTANTVVMLPPQGAHARV